MLPKLEYPTYTMTIPSTGKKVQFRPFTVAEEKTLLMAVESGEADDVTTATFDLVKACVKKVDIDRLTFFDLEYIFLQIRSKSVSNTVELTFKNNKCPMEDEDGKRPCGKTIGVTIDLNDVQIQQRINDDWAIYKPTAKNRTKKISLNDSVGMEIVIPSAHDVLEAQKQEKFTDMVVYIAVSAIEKIWDGDEIHTRSDFSREEAEDFYGSLLPQHKQEIIEFVDNIPQLRYFQEYKCSKCDFTSEIELKGLQDFFG